MMKYFRAILMLVLISFVVFGIGCNDIKLNSHWRDREIFIDGMIFDWEETLLFIENENANIGLLNDNEYIYICLILKDRNTISQVLRLGFTVWFDSKGGTGKNFGIRYPVGMQKKDMSMMARKDKENPFEMEMLIEESLWEMEIINGEKDEVLRAPVNTFRGIDVKIGQINGHFVYELKVPLYEDSDHPFSAETYSDKPIGLGFETGAMNRSMMRENIEKTDRQPGIDKRGGAMGGRPGGRGMTDGGRQQPQLPKQLKLWAKVELAGNGLSETD